MGAVVDTLKGFGVSNDDTQQQPSSSAILGGGNVLSDFIRDTTEPFKIDVTIFKIYAVVTCCIVILIMSWILDRPNSSYVITTFSGLILLSMFMASISTVQNNSKREATKTTKGETPTL